jgi:hypothetical protein
MSNLADRLDEDRRGAPLRHPAHEIPRAASDVDGGRADEVEVPGEIFAVRLDFPHGHFSEIHRFSTSRARNSARRSR